MIKSLLNEYGNVGMSEIYEIPSLLVALAGGDKHDDEYTGLFTQIRREFQSKTHNQSETNDWRCRLRRP
jgi:hypothetical protein